VRLSPHRADSKDGNRESTEVFAAGIEAEEAGDSDKALRLYEQASALDSTAPHIKLRLAYLLYN
jgi:thioredoxin-like negative regulator of GroEL